MQFALGSICPMGKKRTIEMQHVRFEVEPSYFYKKRIYHRKIIMADVLDEMSGSRVSNTAPDSSEFETSRHDAYMGANLVGRQMDVYPGEEIGDNFADCHDLIEQFHLRHFDTE